MPRRNRTLANVRVRVGSSSHHGFAPSDHSRDRCCTVRGWIRPFAVVVPAAANVWSRLVADLEFLDSNDRRLRNLTFTLAKRVGPLYPRCRSLSESSPPDNPNGCSRSLRISALRPLLRHRRSTILTIRQLNDRSWLWRNGAARPVLSPALRTSTTAVQRSDSLATDSSSGRDVCHRTARRRGSSLRCPAGCWETARGGFMF